MFIDIQNYNTIHSFFTSRNLLEHTEGSVLAMTRTQSLLQVAHILMRSKHAMSDGDRVWGHGGSGS